MQRDDVRMAVATGQVEPATRESRDVTGIGDAILVCGDARELREELDASITHELTEIARMVGEESEALGGLEILTLEEHRCVRPEQQKAGHCAQLAGRGELPETPSVDAVRNLIVALDVVDEPLRRRSEQRRAATILLPGVVLPLIQIPVLRGRDELLWRSAIAREIRLGATGECDAGGVMEVIVPDSVEPGAAFVD